MFGRGKPCLVAGSYSLKSSLTKLYFDFDRLDSDVDEFLNDAL